ncbi:MAG TPA: hypothetical protein VIM65_07140 [Cyclobacteriaceae bacterium]
MNFNAQLRPALITILSLSFLVIATACSTAGKFTFGQNIIIKSKSQVRITTFKGVSGINIQVTSIADSRCPDDVICIWAGKADVTFKIDGIDQSVILCPAEAGCNNPYKFTIDKKHYKLTLNDVTPYPTTTNGNEEKKAEFIVEVI